jgi:hypothetical protein
VEAPAMANATALWGDTPLAADMDHAAHHSAGSQHPGQLLTALLTVYASWVLRQKYPRTLREFLGTFALAYLFTDAFLVVLHMFLDHEKNLHYPLQWVVGFSEYFQVHHDNPIASATGNHMADIDGLCTVTLGFIVFWHCVAWAKGRSLPRMLYLWTLMVIFLGELAIFNHSKCHARTHNLEVPAWTVALQDLGVLVHPKTHRAHHSCVTCNGNLHNLPEGGATINVNYNFLVGLSPIYDRIYHAYPNYWALHTVFWTWNPMAVISCVAMASLLSANVPTHAVKGKIE